MRKKILKIILFVAAFGFLLWFFTIGCTEVWCAAFSWQKARLINSFEDCVKFNLPVMESYPRQCRARGHNFVEQVNLPVDILPEANIKVLSPAANGEIGLPLVIQGEARVFENQLNYRLKDSDDSVLVEGGIYANSPDMGQYGPFNVVINYPEPKGVVGVLEVFDYSAKDGSEIDKVIIPVRFGAVESTTVKVYFGNNQIDPQTLYCERSYEVARRIPKITAVARVALEELLLGPTKIEADAGFLTTINTGVKINSLRIENGIANVDFDDTLGFEVGGSCRVAAIRSQITNTLKQFSSVQDVVISINGNTEEILQP